MYVLCSITPKTNHNYILQQDVGIMIVTHLQNLHLQNSLSLTTAGKDVMHDLIRYSPHIAILTSR